MGFGNGKRPANRRSWVKTCDHSCRGKGGAMHSKFFIFSQSGKSKKIVMNTSANLTGASTRVQWNDLYTVWVDSKITYRALHQGLPPDASATSRQPTSSSPGREDHRLVLPGPGQPDLVMGMLNQVKCDGAKKAGINGKTSIRVAQDVFNNKRGATIARKLLALHRGGCSVRVVYSQAVGASKSIIKQLPNNHLVQDRDGDCSYDRYLHAKILAISGIYGGNPSERIVLNGSANWSATAVKSDEQGMIIDRDGAEKKYSKWVNEMFKIHLEERAVRPEPGRERPSATARRRRPFDPYARDGGLSTRGRVRGRGELVTCVTGVTQGKVPDTRSERTRRASPYSVLVLSACAAIAPRRCLAVVAPASGSGSLLALVPALGLPLAPMPAEPRPGREPPSEVVLDAVGTRLGRRRARLWHP